VVWFKVSDVPRFELVVKDMHPVEPNNKDEYEGSPKNLEDHSFFEVLQGRLSEAFRSDAPYRIELTPIKPSPSIPKQPVQLERYSASPVNTYRTDASKRHSTGPGAQSSTTRETLNVTVEIPLRSGSRNQSRSPSHERSAPRSAPISKITSKATSQHEQRMASVLKPSLDSWEVCAVVINT
jgi:hypothetical protein